MSNGKTAAERAEVEGGFVVVVAAAAAAAAADGAVAAGEVAVGEGVEAAAAAVAVGYSHSALLLNQEKGKEGNEMGLKSIQMLYLQISYVKENLLV